MISDLVQQLGVGGGGGGARGGDKYKFLSYYFQSARFPNSHCCILLVLSSLNIDAFFNKKDI